MSIGVYQNYLSYIPSDIYKILIDNNILDGLKFPGNSSDSISNQKLVSLVKELGCSVDNHGWNGISGKLHDPNLFSSDLELNQALTDYLSLKGADSVYTGHLGTQKPLSESELNSILINNIKAIRNFIRQVNPNAEVKIYGEGLFPSYCTPLTTSAEFLNKCASLDNALDGLVLDLCHSVIAAAYIYLKKDPSYSFNRFLDELDCDKVGIIHLSGGYISPSSCGSFKNDDIIDPHTPCHLDDYKRLLSTLERCHNVFRVSNEIAFVCLDRSIDVSVKVYIIEALLTRIAVETRNIAVLRDAQDYLFRASFDNLNDCNLVVENVKKKYLIR